MWRGYTPALACYVRNVCAYWTTIYGFADTVDAQVERLVPGVGAFTEVEMPPWVGSEAFHASHRSNLVRKDPGFYAKVLRWADPPTLDYVWPSSGRA